jgi:hypothetical protein
MSVILGYKAEEKIYLAADNRVTNPKDGTYSDQYTKLIILNKRLAIVCSGCRLAQDKFTDYIKNKNISNWTIEDMKFNLEILCDSLNILNNNNINNLGAYFIVAGLNAHKEMTLWSASWNHGRYSGGSVELALYPPEDVDMQTCCNIYIPNLHEHFSVFMEKTIKEISEKSKMVSYSGDIWMYDLIADTSNLKHFA